MAKIDLTKKQSTEVSLNKHTALPKDRYTLRCMKEEFGMSKTTSQPMVTRTFEFVTESVKLPDGTTLLLAGSEIIRYYALRSIGTAKSSAAKATAMLLDNYKQDTELMGIPTDWSQFDDEHPTLGCEGVIVDAICGDEQQTERRAPLPHTRLGEIIKGLDGKPIITHQAKILQILGPSTTKVNTPY